MKQTFNATSLYDFIEGDLPDYKIQSILGSGSSSTVYLANHLPLGRNVAIKHFSPEYKEKGTDLAKRFQREASMWAQFSHENLIHLYDYKAIGENQYIIMEYCHGTDLRAVMDHMPILPLNVVAAIIYQLVQALEYLHRNGIIHRDLKPANIFIKSDGFVKLMDFGISRSIDLESMTIPGSIMGTPAYMSPEQAMGKKVDMRTDLYALGVMMFEMLEGRKPYKAEIIVDLIAEVADGHHLKLKSNIPRKWKNWIYECMSYEPGARPLSPVEMRLWLERYFQDQQIVFPRSLIRDFVIKNKIMTQEAYLFRNELLQATQANINKTEISVPDHLLFQNPTDTFPWFWMLLTFALIMLTFMYLMLNPDALDKVLVQLDHFSI